MISGSPWMYDGDGYPILYQSTGTVPIYNGQVRQQTLSNPAPIFCGFCHRYSEMDKRGCCINCGAPKMPEGYLMY